MVIYCSRNRKPIENNLKSSLKVLMSHWEAYLVEGAGPSISNAGSSSVQQVTCFVTTVRSETPGCFNFFSKVMTLSTPLPNF